MNKQNLRPQPAQPVNRVATGQLPPELAELSEETLWLVGADASLGVTAAYACFAGYQCSYDGDDAG